MLLMHLLSLLFTGIMKVLSFSILATVLLALFIPNIAATTNVRGHVEEKEDIGNGHRALDDVPPGQDLKECKAACAEAVAEEFAPVKTCPQVCDVLVSRGLYTKKVDCMKEVCAAVDDTLYGSNLLPLSAEKPARKKSPKVLFQWVAPSPRQRRERCGVYCRFDHNRINSTNPM
jgi:hypothetical protein